MRPARLLLLLTALWAGAGLVVALPAHADQLQQCRLVSGRLVMSPGLTNVPADQTITAHGRLSGCSSGGGSGEFAATIYATQATCANLASTMLPADVAFGWSDGQSMMASLTFTSPPGSPNKVAVGGRVISGAALGSRVDGGLRMSVLFPPLAGSASGHANAHTKQERVPLAEKADACDAASPQTTILVSNFEGLALQAPQLHTTPVPASRPLADGSAHAAAHPVPTTTTASTTTTAPPITTPRRIIARKPAQKKKVTKAVAVGSLGDPGPRSSSGSFTNPESLLGAGVATGTLCGCGLLFFRRARLVRRRPMRRRVIR